MKKVIREEEEFLISCKSCSKFDGSNMEVKSSLVDLKGIRQMLAALAHEICGLRNEVSELRASLREIGVENSNLKTGISKLNNKMDDMTILMEKL